MLDSRDKELYCPDGRTIVLALCTEGWEVSVYIDGNLYSQVCKLDIWTARNIMNQTGAWPTVV